VPRSFVTVALPVFDAEATLAEAIHSVRAQTFTAWELLVVCNGCQDGSVAIAQAAAAVDPRVHVHVLDTPNVTLAANHAFEQAKGALVARIDADDRMPPERLAAQVLAMQDNPGWSACSGRVEHDGAPGGMARHVAWLNGLASPGDITHQRFVDSPVANPSTMIRTGLARSLGGYADGDFAEDYDLWLRLLADGGVIGKVDAPVLVWRDLATRLTRTDPRYGDAAMRSLKHRHLMMGPLEGGARPCRIWGSGPYGKRHARGLVAAGANVVEFIDIDPKKIGGVAAGGIPVHGPDRLGPPDGVLTLIAAASRGARGTITARLGALGHRLGTDVLPVQ
jgi:cellulose synthase/poly-beta-1,6-N-acetylglucosamine synthase-like glycosyltransferase